MARKTVPEPTGLPACGREGCDHFHSQHADRDGSGKLSCYSCACAEYLAPPREALPGPTGGPGTGRDPETREARREQREIARERVRDLLRAAGRRGLSLEELTTAVDATEPQVLGILGGLRAQRVVLYRLRSEEASKE